MGANRQHLVHRCAHWERARRGLCCKQGGLIGFTRSLALEVAKDGITVNAILPGPVVTKINDRRLDQIAAERGIRRAELDKSLTPIGRRLGTSEIARVAVFLASDESAGITGQAWNVDGGAVPA
jgi:NAD(P)-dependent dehydrogenase (short-subunit alcohol dehydrogenase family)